jgi:UDP-3-O-[3-hydroxymyristoyl] N-acetylglucosamine deacetylase/3-hydroxyacyl-[acyl-carrier-protein] dehydratase
MVSLCQSRFRTLLLKDANYVVIHKRGTNLEKLGKNTNPEHVLAALVGCDLDNVIIELNASELPIMDGSSKYFVEALEKAELKNKKYKT